MSSDFPGSVPPDELLAILEGKWLWSYFHKDWLIQIRQSLRNQLPVEYQILIESETVFIAPEDQQVRKFVSPDIAVTRSDPAGESQDLADPTVSTAVIETTEVIESEEHYSLVIRRAPANHVIGAVELLSPSNSRRPVDLAPFDGNRGEAPNDNRRHRAVHRKLIPQLIIAMICE